MPRKVHASGIRGGQNSVIFLYFTHFATESQLQIEDDVDDARMTTEQLNELAEACSILSAKSSVIKERDELHALLEQNLQSEKARCHQAS